ncbi:MAG: type II secretion system protein N [Candidatus Rokuibacteriota bacterium]
MPKPLLVGNVVLVAAAALFVLLMVRTARTPWPAPPPARPRPAQAQNVPPAEADAKSPPAPQTYTVIAARNLFSPTRTEAPPPTVTAPPAVVLPKPNLYGVIVREDAPIAYLEDPVTKRVGSYRLGDTIAGGTVKDITRDRVTLARPDGNIDIRLHDPSRPRPAVPPPAPPSAPPGPGAQPPLRPAPVTPPTVGPVPAPPTAEPGIPPRRTLPPSLLRRLPTGAPGDAPQQ